MRRILSILSLSFVLPLAACFDMDMSMTFGKDENVELKTVMTASPEFYAMSSSSGEDLCEEGVGEVQEDGSYVCTDIKTGTIDEITADPDMGEGLTIERRDGGLIYVAFDMGAITDEVGVPQEEAEAEMMDMMREAFTGHAITLNVAGAEIVETNGTISDDGRTASFEIPLTKLLDTPVDLPETFNVLLKPES